jgi:hypothetical protein
MTAFRVDFGKIHKICRRILTLTIRHSRGSNRHHNTHCTAALSRNDETYQLSP